MVKAFLFDLDGVITDTAEFHYKAWEKTMLEYGVVIDYAINEQLKGVSRMESLRRILAYCGKSNDFTEAKQLEIADKKNAYYVQLIEELSPEHILPGILSLLEKMKQEGYLLGLASSSKNAKGILLRLEIMDLFDAIADIEKVKIGKPAPDIFLLAAHMLGVEPGDCIGIEDAESGVESILRAGMFAVGVGDAVSLKRADYFVSETSALELEKILAARQSKKEAQFGEGK